MASKLKIDPHRGKLLTFDLEIAGVTYQDLDARFRINVNGIEYGFEGLLSSDHVDIHIPPLVDIIHDILQYEDNGHVDARLEMHGDHFYYIPWAGPITLEKQPTVKAKVNKYPQKKMKEDVEVDEQQEVIVDDPEPKNEVTLPDPKKEKKSKVEPQSESIFINESTKYEYLKKLKNIDRNGIRDYMTRAGTRSLKIQDIILEQAEGTCRNPEDNFELLKSVVKVMKKIKSGDKK